MPLPPWLENPSSVAVVGASPKEGKVGHEILKNIISYGFRGRVYAVNPKYEEVMGIKSYPTLRDIGEPIDICAIAVPARFVPDVVRDGCAVGCRLFVIFSSGFKEEGRAGLEKEVVETARSCGARVVGPNSAGVGVTWAGLHASIEYPPEPGPVAVITQSGAVGGVIMDKLRRVASGTSVFLSLGNSADITPEEAISWVADDWRTEAVAAYIEWVRDGRAFMEAVREASKEKPVVVLYAPAGEASARAVRSHTGGLASAPEVFAAAARQAGAYLVPDLTSLAEVAEALRKARPVGGRRVLVLTNSGGLGIITAAHLERAGAELPPANALRDRIAEAAGKAPTGNNPLDFGGDARAEHLARALEAVGIEERYDVVVLVYVPTTAEGPDKICSGLRPAATKSKLPVLIYVDGRGSEAVLKCLSVTAPAFSSPATLARGWEAMMRLAFNER